MFGMNINVYCDQGNKTTSQQDYKSTRLQVNKTSTSQQVLQIWKSDVSQLDCYKSTRLVQVNKTYKSESLM